MKGATMQAITVRPGTAATLALEELEEPAPSDGELLVEAVALGVCGTDLEIASGAYGWAPPGRDWLVIGHESLGRVLDAPSGTGFSRGDLVVGIVRRPDPVPCPNCAVGEWDFCRNGRYTERGIKQRDGYGSERWRVEAAFAVRVDPDLGLLGVLLEPTSVVAKAWEQVERVGGRATWQPRRAVVTGAGPIGLLAALLGVQRGLEVHVIDQVTDGPKPELVRRLGAEYHTGPLADACPEPDVVMECTGVPALVFDAMEHVGPGGVVCLTGVSSGGRDLSVDAGMLNRTMVLENEAVVGSVNAARRHYEQAGVALAKADRAWLEGLLTRRVPVGDYAAAFRREPDDVKVVVDFTAS
jgi:threonine dehydrogenase-like Zn-dependent dehydrogenase